MKIEIKHCRILRYLTCLYTKGNQLVGIFLTFPPFMRDGIIIEEESKSEQKFWKVKVNFIFGDWGKNQSYKPRKSALFFFATTKSIMSQKHQHAAFSNYRGTKVFQLSVIPLPYFIDTYWETFSILCYQCYVSKIIASSMCFQFLLSLHSKSAIYQRNIRHV